MEYLDRQSTPAVVGSRFSETLPFDSLVAPSHAALCLDHHRTGGRANVTRQLEAQIFETVRGDVTFTLYAGVNNSCNFALKAASGHFPYTPVQTNKMSAHAAITMLGLAKRTTAKKFRAYTSQICGDLHQRPKSAGEIALDGGLTRTIAQFDALLSCEEIRADRAPSRGRATGPIRLKAARRLAGATGDVRSSVRGDRRPAPPTCSRRQRRGSIVADRTPTSERDSL